MPTALLFSLTTLLALSTAQAGRLVILDTGVGHRSTTVPRWATSLRSVDTAGADALTLQSFGPVSESGEPAQPINGYSLAYAASVASAFLATGQGIVRAGIATGDHQVVVAEGEGRVTSVSVVKSEAKLYYSTRYEGLIKKANLDGSNVETVRNVSQGINYDSGPSYTPANSYADGILVDEEKGWLYWSASRGPDQGSIRRAPLTAAGEEEVMATGLNMPGQLRLVRDTTTRTNSLWWAEKGRWNTSPTALKLLDLYRFAEFPSSTPRPSTSSVQVAAQTMIHSDNSSIFFENDDTGEKQTLSIQSYVVFRDNVSQKVWFVLQSSGRTMFGKLVEMTWQGSGGARKAVLKVLNQDTKDIGVPVGLEYVG